MIGRGTAGHSVHSSWLINDRLNTPPPDTITSCSGFFTTCASAAAITCSTNSGVTATR